MKKVQFLLLPFFCAALCLNIRAQETTESVSVFFSSDRHELSREARKKLEEFMSSNPLEEGCSFRIYGYTDSDGTAEYNAALAGKRCESVMAYLSVAGNKAEVAAIGEENPFAENTTEEGKQANRRVDIYLDCRVRDRVDTGPVKETVSTVEDDLRKLEKLRMDSLMRALAAAPQIFNIDPFEDTTIVCEGGSKLIFTANSMKLNNARPGELVRIEVIEVFEKSDMILNNMTTTSGHAILESGGMLDVRAYFDGKPVKLNSGSTFTAMVPSSEYNPNMSLFDGRRGSDDQHTINWKERSVNNFGFMLSDDFFNCQFQSMASSYRCNFWCRLKGRFNWKYRKYVAIRSRPQRQSQCNAFERMMNLYETDVQNQIKKGLWDDEFKRWNVTTIEEYYEARLAAREKKIDQGIRNNNGYYVFSNAGFGTINCDFFKPQDGPLKPLFAALENNSAYCTFVIHRANSCLGGYKLEEGCQFEIPNNTPGTIVAMYYYQEQVFFATREVNGPGKIEDLVYEALTIEEVKARLKKLNDIPRLVAMR